MDLTIPSVNYIYKPGKTKQGRLYLRKDTKVKKFQEEFIEKGEKTDLAKIRDMEIDTFECFLTFYIKKRFWTRDVSNMVKAVEDAIVEIIGVDDSRVTDICGRKRMVKSSVESIGVELILKEKK